MASTDVVVLGAGLRGLWLASEIVQSGWSATWVQIGDEPAKASVPAGFQFDDWPWQLGPVQSKSKTVQALQEFVSKVIKPKAQDVAIQIITPDGPVELSGGAEARSLKKFFGGSAYLRGYLKMLQDIQKTEETKASQLLAAYTLKVFQEPLCQRWCLEWLGNLRRSRNVSTKDWILNWDGEMFNPNWDVWLLEEGLDVITDRAIHWAEKNGVIIKNKDRLVDVGVEGRAASGIELVGAEGFLHARFIVVCCSHQRLMRKAPKLAHALKSPMKHGSEDQIWIRCGFYMKPGSRPSGCLEFSSYVVDPQMPLVESNMGLIRWHTGEKGDSITVWARVPFEECKRQSYLVNLTESVKENMVSLLPWFSEKLVSVIPFHGNIEASDFHDMFPVVFNKDCQYSDFKTRLRNVWLAGPEFDRGLELISSLATEYRVFKELNQIREKELKRDRALPTSRNGQDLVDAK